MQRLPTWAIYNMAPGAQGGMEKGSEPMLRLLIEESSLRERVRVRVFGDYGTLQLDIRRYPGFGDTV